MKCNKYFAASEGTRTQERSANSRGRYLKAYVPKSNTKKRDYSEVSKTRRRKKAPPRVAETKRKVKSTVQEQATKKEISMGIFEDELLIPGKGSNVGGSVYGSTWRKRERNATEGERSWRKK
ncbi:hypothetical protein V5799_031465 [Amblyomma americanum]|uniref:Uncharacterized protein n=1 Tax=Amblyomma americanum TaxID=6943 RepID=A0AAQ4EKK3_AMBAM